MEEGPEPEATMNDTTDDEYQKSKKQIEAESVSTTSTTTTTTTSWIGKKIEIRRHGDAKEDHNYCVVTVAEFGSGSGRTSNKHGSRKSDTAEKRLYMRKRENNNFSVKMCRAKYKKKIGCVRENIKKIEGDNSQLKQSICHSKFELKFWKKLHQIVAESQDPGTGSKILDNLTKDPAKVLTLMKRASLLTTPTPMTKLHHQREPRRRLIFQEKGFENQNQEEEITQPRTDMGIEKGDEEQEPAPTAAVEPESEPQEQQAQELELVEQAEQLSLSLQVPVPVPTPAHHANNQTETQTIVINISLY